jgi:hypothetical protein
LRRLPDRLPMEPLRQDTTRMISAAARPGQRRVGRTVPVG